MMVSPRYNSSGVYSTRVPNPRTETQTEPGSFIRESESGEHIAIAVMQAYLEGLPTTSWVAMRIIHTLREEEVLDAETEKLIRRLWLVLMELEDRLSALCFRTVLSTDQSGQLMRRKETVEEILREPGRILIRSMAAVHKMNPALLRSGRMHHRTVVKVALVNSGIKEEFRRDWNTLIKRAEDLILTK